MSGGCNIEIVSFTPIHFNSFVFHLVSDSPHLFALWQFFVFLGEDLC